MVLVAAAIALSSLWWPSFAQVCPVQTAPGFANFGHNRGGCFMCYNEQSQLPSAAELLELCGQTCLADPSCRAFETSASAALRRVYNLSFGAAVNCCIEHTAMAYFENPLAGDENSTDNCRKLAACTSTHAWAEDCPRPSPPPPRPSTCLRDPSNVYVHDTEERIWGLRQWISSGCVVERDESTDAAWESLQCQETDRAPLPGQTLLHATRDSGGDTCSYYEDRPQYCGCCDTPLFSAARDCPACDEPPPAGNATWWTEVFQAWPRKAVELRLEDKGIQGQLPENFAERWPNLVSIALGGNNFHGQLPNLGTLVNLRSLHLQGNQLTGTLPPGFGNLSRLTQLRLQNNQLSGAIPPELGKLTALQELNLTSNRLSGAIPAELGKLSSLLVLCLNGNQLSGAIPAELGKLAALQELALDHNQLTGAIPADLGKLSNLQVRLDLQVNQLSGAIPAELGDLWALQELRLDRNELSGRIPGELGGLKSLRELHLHSNHLSGALPAELGNNLSSLETLDLAYNELSGSIPAELGSLRTLRMLSLSGNLFNGSIPAELGQLGELYGLALWSNRLSGSIPPELGRLRKLVLLILKHNQLSGSIPAELGSLRWLLQLDLAHNQLTGTIPPQLGSFFPLFHTLDLQDNQLSGRIPAELGELSGLQILMLQNNRLSGSLPSTLGYLRQLITLDIYDNQLEGGLPASFRQLSALNNLHASRNPHLCGTLSSLSDLRELRTLRLRGCCFQDIHISRPPDGLEYLDLGENKLTALPESLQEGLTAVKTLLLDRNSMGLWDTSSVVPLSQFDEAGMAKCGFFPASSPLAWLKLEVLDVSANLLSPLAYDFLASLSHLPHLKHLRAADNRLSGAVPALVSRGRHDFVLNLPHTGNCTALAAAAPTSASAVRESLDLPPAFPALVMLDLARNSITAMLSSPTQQLQQVDLSGNQLTGAGLSDRWWGGGAALQLVNMLENPALRLPIRLDPAGGCPVSGVLPNLTANAQDWRRVGAGSECATLCPRQTLLWMDFTVQEEVLCRCSAGQGVGLNCTACPTNSHSVQSFDREAKRYVRTCRECPVHSELRGAAAQCFADCSCGEGYYMRKVVNGSATEVGSSSCSFLRAEAQQNGQGEENLLGECRSCGIWKTSKAGSGTLASCLCNGNASNGGWLGLLQEGAACRCPDGQRIDFAQRRCVQCDLAEDCTDWSKLLKPPKVKEGFWALPPPLEGEDGLYGNFSGHSIWRCDSPEACPGQSGACGWNRIGTACSLCKRGFFRTPSGSCSRCPQTYTQTRLMLLAALAACMIFPLLAHGVLSADSDSRGLVMTLRSFRISLKQLVKFAQILGVVSLFQVEWPAMVLSLFEVFRHLSFDFASWVGVACLTADQQQTVALELSFRWMLPVFGAAVTALSALLATSCGLLCLRRRTGTRLGQLLTFRFWDVLRVLLFFLQLFFPSILNNALLPLTCSPSPNGHLTMNAFPHIICFDLKHDAGFWSLALVGFVFTGLLIAGYPFLIFRLWRLAKVGSMVRAAEDRWWSFLFEDFRFDGMGYTLVVLGKDVLLNLITVVLPGLGTAQLLLTAVVSIGFAWLVHNAMPFEDSSNTLMEVCTSAAVAALCIFSAGMGFQSEPEVLDISSYIKEGRDNPVYLQRAFTLICLQGLSLLAPAVIISYQVLSAFGRTRRCIPRTLLPVTDEQREAWRRDFDLAPFFVDQCDDVALGSLHRILMSSTAARRSLRRASSREQPEPGLADLAVEQQQQQSQATAKPREEAPAAAEKEIVEI